MSENFLDTDGQVRFMPLRHEITKRCWGVFSALYSLLLMQVSVPRLRDRRILNANSQSGPWKGMRGSHTRKGAS